MGFQAGSQPWVRGSDLLPVIQRFMPEDFGSERYELSRYDTTQGMSRYQSFAVEVTRYVPMELNSVQKMLRQLIFGQRATVPFTVADAFAVAACTTLETEEIPVFFQTRPLATEAVEVYEDMAGITLDSYSRSRLAAELVLVARQVRAGKPAVASSMALAIMGQRACPQAKIDTLYVTRKHVRAA